MASIRNILADDVDDVYDVHVHAVGFEVDDDGLQLDAAIVNGLFEALSASARSRACSVRRPASPATARQADKGPSAVRPGSARTRTQSSIVLSLNARGQQAELQSIHGWSTRVPRVGILRRRHCEGTM